MLRLRTTTALSLVALAVGIAGTHWLSGMNAGWAGPSERVAGFVPAKAPRAAPARVPRRAPRIAQRVAVPVPSAMPTPAAPAMSAVPALVPLSMPQGQVSWSRMEGHLQGRVLVHVAVAGDGRVTGAALAASSGDPVLDAYALATVQGWRFAVPADHPDGFSGDLPMRFTSGGQRVAQAP